MWAIDPGSSLLNGASSEDEDEVEDRRSSASFLRSLGGDDVDDLLNPKEAAEPVLAPSILNISNPPPKPRKDVRYFEEEPAPLFTRRRDVCFLCGSADHHANTCPQSVCFQCLQPGHTSKECPESGGHQIFLQRVRAITHRSNARQLDLSQVRCLLCGGLGHVDCSPDDGRPKNLTCLNCGRGGHDALNCIEEGMDRWHRRFAPLAGPGGRGGGGGDGGGASRSDPGPARFRRASELSNNRPGPPPEKFRNRPGPPPGRNSWGGPDARDA